jgi:hypothetical protein
VSASVASPGTSVSAPTSATTTTDAAYSLRERRSSITVVARAPWSSQRRPKTIPATTPETATSTSAAESTALVT